MITRNTMFALFVSVALTGAAMSQAADLTPEYGIEANTSWVLLPSSSQGAVVLTCDDCKQESFQLTSNTIYQVGKSSVSFAEFVASVRGPARNLMVFVYPNRTVHRMSVSAAAAQ